MLLLLQAATAATAAAATQMFFDMMLQSTVPLLPGCNSCQLPTPPSVRT